jgi:two-component system, chemotaxis family, protein-glutamate methylesterase/glutaminase
MATPKRNIIVIGASAGGVEALCELTRNLPKDLDASVFIVMHIGQESMLPHILSRCGNLPAVHAQNNVKYKRGSIYVAPSNHHLTIKDHMTMLNRGPRENGHRPAIDVLFRSAARAHRRRVIGVVLSGGLDDGSAGLYAIKARGGVAIVQDPSEAITPSMPRSAIESVDVDYCLPVSQIATILTELAQGGATTTTESPNGGNDMSDKVTEVSEESAIHHPETNVPLSCPECNGPLYELKEGELSRFQCIVGHAFSPDGLSEQHTEALERALWTAMRTLKERTMLHRKLLEHRRNRGEEELMQRLEESIGTAENDLKLLREVLDRI